MRKISEKTFRSDFRRITGKSIDRRQHEDSYLGEFSVGDAGGTLHTDKNEKSYRVGSTNTPVGRG